METKPESEEKRDAALRELAAAYLDLWEAQGAYFAAPPRTGAPETPR